MTNILLLLVILGILGFAIGYVISQKKKGTRCIGCPHGGNCDGNCGSCH